MGSREISRPSGPLDHCTQMQEMKYPVPPETMDSKDLVYPMHKRSKSDTDKRMKEEASNSLSKSSHHLNFDVKKANGHTDIDMKPSLDTKTRSSLKQEILQLEKRLKDQMGMRHTLEKTLGHKTSAVNASNDSIMPKTAKDLIREIAVLELEVVYLEQHLLCLYRKAFDPQISTPTGDKSKCVPSSQSVLPQSVSTKKSLPHKSFTRVNESPVFGCPEKLTGPGVHRSQSDLSYRTVCSSSYPTVCSSRISPSAGSIARAFQSCHSQTVCSARISPSAGSIARAFQSCHSQTVCSARISPSAGSIARAFQSCHSQPLSFFEDEDDSSSRVASLAEYLGTNIAAHVPETPNKVSESMVRCMGSIYHKLSDSSLVHQGHPCSPTSSFTSMSELSPRCTRDVWSPHYQRESTLDARLINPFCVEGLKEFSGPYNTMVEVPLICRDNWKMHDVNDMLQNYESLVRRLERVEPRKMKNEEKLAFWINIHNAMTMHAYLVLGIPQNNMRRPSILVKAMCIIGGRKINMDTIQSSILRCRTHYSGQWLRAFISTKMKRGQGYAIEHPEPLLHFALCSGSYSDPAVRIYTPKKIFEQLETAKEEYIRATIGIQKEQKILLPKIVDSYAKDTGLNSLQLLSMIQQCLPETLRRALRRCQQGRSHKIIEWMPHNFSFRYLLSKELAIAQIN